MIGYKFFLENKFRWRLHQQAIIPLTMPHLQPNISTRLASKLLLKKKKILIRWDEEFDSISGGEWWHVIKDKKEDINLYKKKIRYMIRKGEEFYYCEICDKESIKESGYPVYQEAYTRYDTFEPLFKKSAFQKSVDSLPSETEFWGVYERETKELIAFSENLVAEGACFYLTMWVKPLALKRFASYILFHKMNEYYLNEKKMKYVSDGSRSISHNSNIHDFLVSKFGFRKAYSRLKVVYFPGMYPFIIILYPLRNIIRKIPSIGQKIFILLDQERIRRSCMPQPSHD